MNRHCWYKQCVFRPSHHTTHTVACGLSRIFLRLMCFIVVFNFLSICFHYKLRLKLKFKVPSLRILQPRHITFRQNLPASVAHLMRNGSKTGMGLGRYPSFLVYVDWTLVSILGTYTLQSAVVMKCLSLRATFVTVSQSGRNAWRAVSGVPLIEATHGGFWVKAHFMQG